MTNEIKEFRDGIFALRTRRFGTVAELIAGLVSEYGVARYPYTESLQAIRKQM